MLFTVERALISTPALVLQALCHEEPAIVPITYFLLSRFLAHSKSFCEKKIRFEQKAILKKISKTFKFATILAFTGYFEVT